ncbi:MAG: hypothetical protein HFG38_03575 [Eubacterium sp.]|nr:hypothetical protein [Eubacterium sp.]
MSYKSNDVTIIEWEKIILEELVMRFCTGEEVVWVTRKGMLSGRITSEDMIRYLLYCNGRDFPEKLVNQCIKYLIYEDEKQICNEADQIFSEKSEINIIPVVDKNKKFLFQISREKKRRKNQELERGIHELAVVIENGTMELFLKQQAQNKLVLTGADLSILKRIKRLISSLMVDDISVTITDNILDCCKLDDDSFIISISRLGMIYLRNEKNCQVDIFSAIDIVHYDDFKKLNSIEGKVDCKLAETFRYVFGYHTIVFFADHPAVTYWTKMSTGGGVTVYDKKYADFSAVNVKFLSPFYILLISGEDGEFHYYCPISEFVKIFEWLYKYREIAQCDLTHDIYINKCLNYLKDFQASGFSGWVHTVYSQWEAQLQLYTKNIDGFDMIENPDDLMTQKKYVLDPNRGIRRIMTGDIEITNECFMGYICESMVVEILMGKCRNVWTLYFSSFEHLPFKYIPHQTRLDFMRHRETFPEQFVEDLFGNEDYPIMDLLKDMSGGTQLVQINEGYQKFVSNYRSAYFNTDLFGHRIVRESPPNADRKIWLMGSCVFSGYVEEDAYTVASCIQRKINEEFSGQYEVIDVSCDSGNICYNYNKMLEKKVSSEDIVVIHCDYFHEEHRAIQMDMKKIDEYFGSSSECVE